ncbi:MAG: hypothetical protein LBE86_05295 [Gemmobacter sp.]|nr:hypothetical protein [Gemmobacter sp.]
MAEPDTRASEPDALPAPRPEDPVFQSAPEKPGPEKPELASGIIRSASQGTSRPGGGAGRFLGLLLGGVAAAVLGFGLATYGVRKDWPLLRSTAPQTEALAAELAALKAEATALSDRVAGLEVALDARVTPPIDLVPLEARIAALEAAPTGGDAAGLGQLQAQVAELSARLSAERDSAAQITAEIDAQVKERMGAAEAEAAALRDGAEKHALLLDLKTAFRSGVDLSKSIAAAKAAGIDLPPPVAALADHPLSLSGLQAEFPEAARAALAATRYADMGDTFTERALTFLKSQTNARALTPQDGTDPDAVLSRMEDALDGGDIATTRALADDLPEPGRAALAGWLAEADAWLAADAALAALLAEQ